MKFFNGKERISMKTNPPKRSPLVLHGVTAVLICIVAGCSPNAPEEPADRLPAERVVADDATGVAKPSDGGSAPSAAELPGADTADSVTDTQEDVAAPDPEKGTSPDSGVEPVSFDDPADQTANPESKQPAKKREKLFVGWDKPLATLFVTGRQDGYVEPCGCTGFENQLGGVNRRFTLIEQLQEEGWQPVAMDVGNQVKRFGRQPEIKFQITIDGLKQMGYQVVAFGLDDLKLSIDELIAIVAPQADKPTPFVCANVNLLDLTPKYRVVETNGKRLGITSILGTSKQKGITADEIELTPPEEALGEVWPKLKAENCDLYVLLAHASIFETGELARTFPGFDVVVTSGGSNEPTHEPDKITGSKGLLVQVGNKGKYVCVIGLFEDEPVLRYQRVPLDDRFKDAKAMIRLMGAYQQQLETLGWKGLGLKPQNHPSGRQFVGSNECGDCHTKAYEIWEKTRHARATKTLVKPPERADVPRHFDPECISCHVVGWNPQKYYPYKSGYESLKS